MYGAPLPTRRLHAVGSVTHLREYDGRAIHVVGWSRKQIAEWQAEQDRLAREHGFVSEVKGPGQAAQMNRRMRHVLAYSVLIIGSALAIYWLGVGW